MLHKEVCVFRVTILLGCVLLLNMFIVQPLFIKQLACEKRCRHGQWLQRKRDCIYTQVLVLIHHLRISPSSQWHHNLAVQVLLFHLAVPSHRYYPWVPSCHLYPANHEQPSHPNDSRVGVVGLENPYQISSHPLHLILTGMETSLVTIVAQQYIKLSSYSMDN